MNIREYDASDLEACRDLWRDLTQRHRDIYEDPTIGGVDPGPYFDEHYLKHPHFHKLWVSEVDGEVVGLCGLLVDGDEAELEPIVVKPDRRGGGIGDALAARAIKEASDLGKRYINVRPVGRNAEAISFFRRAGFDVLSRVELSLRLHSKPFPDLERTVEIHGASFLV